MNLNDNKEEFANELVFVISERMINDNAFENITIRQISLLRKMLQEETEQLIMYFTEKK